MTLSHRLSYTRAYAAWYNMRLRCLDPDNEKFPLYGGRGITICEEWDTVEGFYADMGEAPPGYTLDRIDSNGPYRTSNCRWETQLVQQNNRTNNVRVTWQGEDRTISQWSRELGLKYHTLYRRIVIKGESFPEAARGVA